MSAPRRPIEHDEVVARTRHCRDPGLPVTRRLDAHFATAADDPYDMPACRSHAPGRARANPAPFVRSVNASAIPSGNPVSPTPGSTDALASRRAAARRAGAGRPTSPLQTAGSPAEAVWRPRRRCPLRAARVRGRSWPGRRRVGVRRARTWATLLSKGVRRAPGQRTRLRRAPEPGCIATMALEGSGHRLENRVALLLDADGNRPSRAGNAA